MHLGIIPATAIISFVLLTDKIKNVMVLKSQLEF